MAKTITISQVLADLEAGVTRPQMATKYEITPREVNALFQHPKLKGKKAKKVFIPSFDIVDDTPDASTETVDAEPVGEAAPEPAAEKKDWE